MRHDIKIYSDYSVLITNTYSISSVVIYVNRINYNYYVVPFFFFFELLLIQYIRNNLLFQKNEIKLPQRMFYLGISKYSELMSIEMSYFLFQAEFYPQTITETVFDVLPRVRESVNGVNFLERLWAYLTIRDLLERVAKGDLNSCDIKVS